MSHNETEALKIIFRIANNSDKKFFLIVPYIYVMETLYCRECCTADVVKM